MAAPISAEDAKAFYDASETKSIIVVDPTESTTRSYDLYQIFDGVLKEGTLTYITWGDSIVGVSDGKTYDYSDQLVAALQADTLATGEANPIKADFAKLKADAEVKKIDDAHTVTTTYSARAVADIVATFNNSSEKIDAFATAVAGVIGDKAVEKRSQSKSDKGSSGTEYEFEGITDGYYLVSETTVGSTLMYSSTWLM
jgi:hypothetical protein